MCEIPVVPTSQCSFCQLTSWHDAYPDRSYPYPFSSYLAWRPDIGINMKINYFRGQGQMAQCCFNSEIQREGHRIINVIEKSMTDNHVTWHKRQHITFAWFLSYVYSLNINYSSDQIEWEPQGFGSELSSFCLDAWVIRSLWWAQHERGKGLVCCCCSVACSLCCTPSLSLMLRLNQLFHLPG